ncbi:Uncharacterized protein TCM_045156 [Theobroma cacao]|uniref:Uncharacterized protein n=1 Tax=Theobroma cacao TaxID=3641 RepID=A0A061FR81_THECC|nr:Uncharacterized protein TCM_045156 [Theobroma cacao]
MKKRERYDWQGADAPCQAPLSPARREFFASGRVVERPLQSPEIGYKWEGENLQQRGGSFLSNGEQPRSRKIEKEGEAFCCRQGELSRRKNREGGREPAAKGENLQQRERTCSKGGTSFLSNGKQPENQKNREAELCRKIEKRRRGVLLPAQEEGAPDGGRERGAAVGAAPEREERRLARHQICK